ncbi:RagB/SusD family nutrient uptake outer membrane protein [Chitinophaga lutea]
MHHRQRYTFLAAMAMLLLGACKQWLDIKPEDRFTEEMIFANEQGFSDALNGVYLKMGEKTLYGGDLTLSILDVLAQRYAAPDANSKWFRYATLEYSDATVRTQQQRVWENMYISIAYINDFLEASEKYKQNLPAGRLSFYKGQALALRAYLYFDLLRMWGPVYASADSVKPAIPVYRKLEPAVKEFLPANQVMDIVLGDLTEAETLLADDPAAQTGYRSNGNFRMNIYAVKGLMARALLYRGNQAAALVKAQEVIAAKTQFPFLVPSALIDNREYPDRIFGTEVLFGVHARGLYEQYRDLFNPELQSISILAAGNLQLLDKVYEGNLSDFRYSHHWLVNASGVSFRGFYKYADVQNKDRYAFRYMVPLLRMSEMYYIAAECDPSPAQGLKYLDSVRFHRNITTPLTNPARLGEEIALEYQKEFYGEGQLWYFYKRKKFAKVNSANNNNGVSIAADKYVFAYPDSETSVR